MPGSKMLLNKYDSFGVEGLGQSFESNIWFMCSADVKQARTPRCSAPLLGPSQRFPVTSLHLLADVQLETCEIVDVVQDMCMHFIR